MANNKNRREERKFRMMELGIDDNDNDKKNNVERTNTDEDVGATPSSSSSSSNNNNNNNNTNIAEAFSGDKTNQIVTRIQYYYRLSGLSEYPLITLALGTMLFWLLISFCSSLIFDSSYEGNGLKLRPANALPRRFRFGENGVPKERANAVRIMPASDFRHFDELKSFMHATELAGLGVDTEGHVLKQRPLMELNKANLKSLLTSPPPPLAPGEEEKKKREVYDVDLPKGFNRWDEVHQNIWRKAKEKHIQELRVEAMLETHAKATNFIMNDKDHKELDKVLQEESAERARAHLQHVLREHDHDKFPLQF